MTRRRADWRGAGTDRDALRGEPEAARGEALKHAVTARPAVAGGPFSLPAGPFQSVR